MKGSWNQYWQPLMVRAILDFIDEQKGDDSIFIVDKRRAFEETKIKMRPATMPQTYERLTSDRIEKQLIKRAQKGGLAENDIDRLYKHGSTVLDIAKLDGVYSTKEVAHKTKASSQQNVARPPKQSNRSHEPKDTVSLKRKAGVLDGDECEEESTEDSGDDAADDDSVEDKNDHDYKDKKQDNVNTPIAPEKRIIREKPQKSVPSQSLEAPLERHVAPTHIQAKIRRKAGEITHTLKQNVPTTQSHTTSHSNTCSSGLVPEYIICAPCGKRFSLHLFEDHKHTHFREHLPHGTCVCPIGGCRAYFANVEDLRSHTSMHETYNTMHEALTQPGIGRLSGTKHERDANIQFPDQTKYSRRESEIIRFLQRGETAYHMDVKQIQSEMAELQKRIYSHTLDFFLDTEIKERSWVRLDLKSCAKPLTDLLLILFGEKMHGIGTLRWDWSQAQDYLQASELVTAIIGIAVVEWALKPRPQGEIGNGLLKAYTDVISGMSQAMQDHILELATKKHLEERVAPVIERVAKSLADKIISSLAPVFAGLQAKQDEDLPSTVASTIQAESTAKAAKTDFSDASHSITYPDATDPYTRLTERLARDVFAQALKLRYSMEHCGHAIYTFQISQVQDRLDFSQHTVRNKDNNEEISRVTLCQQDGFRYDDNGRNPDRQIKIVLFPSLMAKFKETRDGPWGKAAKLLVKAQVHLWNKQYHGRGAHALHDGRAIESTQEASQLLEDTE